VAPADAPYRGVGPKGYRRSDPNLRERVCERLLLDPYLDASGIVVRVSKGRVSLSGRVATERMRSAAVAAAESIAGGAVDAALAVDAPAAARPSRLKAKSARRVPVARRRGGRR
jgi:osmotically-inducible protein OsmY